MSKKSIIEQLQNIVGKQNVITDEQTLNERSVDWLGYNRWEVYHNQYIEEKALCVVNVNSSQEISEVLTLLNKNSINVIPVTGKSSVTAAIRTPEGCVILDASALNEIISFDTTNFIVTVQCGTPLEYLEGYCNLRGYTTGHFPQSLPLAQIGGLVATRSIGQLSTYYGGIEDMIVGLEAVLPTGEIVKIKDVPRRAVGPDLRHVFMGSEGTMGIITQVSLKLFKLPADKWQMAYAVKNMDDGLDALRDIMQEGWRPCVARLHDAYEAQHSYSRFVSEGESVLFFVAYGPEGYAQLTGNAIDSICESYGFKKIGSKLVDVWFETRNDVAYKKQRHSKIGNIGETIEISANWSCIGDIYKTCVARGIDEIDDVVQFSAHSSHSYVQGTNMYFIIRFKASDDLEANRAKFAHVYDIIMEETLKFGGSISHHHGVGKYRAKWIPREHGSSYVVLERLKQAMDPNNIMNIGTLLPK